MRRVLRVAVEFGLLYAAVIVLAVLPDVPDWLWYVKRVLMLVVLVQIVRGLAVEWRGRSRTPDDETYVVIRLPWPVVAVIGFGLICVLLLVTQLLGAR